MAKRATIKNFLSSFKPDMFVCKRPNWRSLQIKLLDLFGVVGGMIVQQKPLKALWEELPLLGILVNSNWWTI